MKIFSWAIAYIVFYLFTSGIFLLALVGVQVGYLDWATYLLLIRVGLVICGFLLLAGILLSVRRRMVQLHSMDNPSDQQSAESKPAQVAPAVEVLSEDKAREWLDDFLVEQQAKK